MLASDIVLTPYHLIFDSARLFNFHKNYTVEVMPSEPGTEFNSGFHLTSSQWTFVYLFDFIQITTVFSYYMLRQCYFWD